MLFKKAHICDQSGSLNYDFYKKTKTKKQIAISGGNIGSVINSGYVKTMYRSIAATTTEFGSKLYLWRLFLFF